MRLKLAVVAALFLLSVVADAADVDAGSSTGLAAAAVADAIVSVDDPRGPDAGRWLPAPAHAFAGAPPAVDGREGRNSCASATR